MLSLKQQLIINSRSVEPLFITLHDPFGGVIGEWVFKESHPGHRGFATLVKHFRAFECDELTVPFTSPGGDGRAQFYFRIGTHPIPPREPHVPKTNAGN